MEVGDGRCGGGRDFGSDFRLQEDVGCTQIVASKKGASNF
jgi:hypothetical protein